MQAKQSMSFSSTVSKMTRRSIFVLGLVGGLATWSVQAAMIPLGIEEMVAHSDNVVHGQVAEEQEVVFTSGRIYTVSQFIVKDSFKGDYQAGEAIQIAIPGGEIGAIGMIATNLAQLKPNEELVLFLDNPREEQVERAATAANVPADHPILRSPRIIGGGQGKFSIVRDEVQEAVQGRTAVKEVTRVAREVPGRRPRLSDFPSVEDFGQAIREIADGKVPVRSSVRLTPNSEPVNIAQRNPETKALRIFDPFGAAEKSRLPEMAPIQPDRTDGDVTAEPSVD